MQHYETSHPGQVHVLGCDLFNCTAAGLRNFRDQTGATFPLLLNAASAAGGNLQALYGERDHYVVINTQGIVRYQGNDRWPYGNGYHLDELRGCIDSLVTATTGVGAGLDRIGPLDVEPNPSRSGVRIRLGRATGAESGLRVEITDVPGRRVAVLWDGPRAAGERAFEWDGTDARGRLVAPGLYRVRVTAGGVTRERRLIRIR